MSSSLHSNEQWPVDDDFSHSDAGHASEICSNDPGSLQIREINMPGFSSSDGQYQLMCLDDRLLLELQSIGLCPETLVNILLCTFICLFSSHIMVCSSILFHILYASYAFLQPDLAEGEVINQDIMELKEGLHQQVVCLGFFFSIYLFLMKKVFALFLSSFLLLFLTNVKYFLLNSFFFSFYLVRYLL
jgi:hypothetical protein